MKNHELFYRRKGVGTGKDYRNKHIGIILMLGGAVVSCLLPIPDFWQSAVSAFFSAMAGSALYRSAKGDELCEQNISRANKIVMAVLIATLIIIGCMGDNKNDVVRIKANVFPIIAVCALILRSLLFLWFDRTPKNDE